MVLKKTYYLFLLCFCFALSKQLSAQELFSADTLKVNESCLVYWQLTMPEYDSVFTDKTIKLDSLFCEFNTNILNLNPYLSKKGMTAHRTDGKYILFRAAAGNVIYERKNLCSVFGVILFDPLKQPLILNGVNKNIFIMQKMKEYFQK